MLADLAKAADHGAATRFGDTREGPGMTAPGDLPLSTGT